MKIKLYKKNAKQHPKEQIDALANVVKKIGWRQPIIVNQQGVIVVGHGRWIVHETYPDLPEPWVLDDKGNTIMGKIADTELSEQEEKMWRLADNQLNALSGFDMDLVIDELKELDDTMIDLTGFDKSIIDLNYNFKNKEIDIEKLDNEANNHTTKTCPNCGYEF